MTRMARVVIPGYPDHITQLTQRGNLRQETLFSENDYPVYIGLMAEKCTRSKVAIWAYCLMPNHVIVTPLLIRKKGFDGRSGKPFEVIPGI
jgi:putative transposase